MKFTTKIVKYMPIKREEIERLKKIRSRENTITIIENKFPYGRYKGSRVSDILNRDLQYVLWFIKEINPTIPSDLFNEIIIKMRNSYLLKREPRRISEKDKKTRNLRFIRKRLKLT